MLIKVAGLADGLEERSRLAWGVAGGEPRHAKHVKPLWDRL